MATPQPGRRRDGFRETLAPTAPVRTYRSEVVPAGPSLAQQIVRTAAVILGLMLSMRFVLALFGASHDNGLVKLIFSTTNWMVRPFGNVFGTPATGVGGYFDWAAFVAIVVVLLAAAIIMRLLRPGRSS